MRGILAGLVAIAVVAAVLAALPTPPEPVVGGGLVRGARVFDGSSFHEEMDVRWRDGIIVAVAPDLEIQPGETVVDGRGMTVLPGLIDAHAHVFADATRRALAYGVTTEIDLFSAASELPGHRRHRRSLDPTDQADVFSAGTLVTTPGGHGTEYGMTIPMLDPGGDAADFVAERIAEGSDLIKIVHDDGALYGYQWATLDPATLAAVVQAAHAHGVLAVAHVSTREQALEALEAGMDGLVHLIADRPVDDVLVERLRASDAFVVPTLTVLSFRVRGDGGRHALMFLPADGGVPMRYDFDTGPHWRPIEVAVAEVPGLAGRDLTGLIVGTGPAPGRFELAIDEVVVR